MVANEENLKNLPCSHKGKLTYLDTVYTPMVRNPNVMQVAVHMFLCESCQSLVRKDLVIPRGYNPDGSVHPDLAKELENTLRSMLVQEALNTKKEVKND